MRSSWLVVGLVAVLASAASARPGKPSSAKPGAADAAPTKAKAPPGRGADGSGSGSAGPGSGSAGPGSDAGSGSDADGAGSDADPFGGLAHITGPALVDLGHGAELDLAAGLVLFERDAAQEILRKGGDSSDSAVAFIVGGGDWSVVIEADDVGYVSDDDGGDLDANALLQSYREGTAAQNRERVRLGVPELFIDGWSEPPHYDRATHHLVWGLSAHATDGKIINFFTRFLGRNGYLSVNLIAPPEAIEASKVEAMSILSALRFKPGARYADHVSSDKDSGMGLTALIVGGTAIVAAKKTGILIAILLFLKKGIIVVFAAVAGFFRWLTGRKKPTATPPMPPGPPPSPPSPGDAPGE